VERQPWKSNIVANHDHLDGFDVGDYLSNSLVMICEFGFEFKFCHFASDQTYVILADLTTD